MSNESCNNDIYLAKNVIINEKSPVLSYSG